jgi:hypothetical protein
MEPSKVLYVKYQPEGDGGYFVITGHADNRSPFPIPPGESEYILASEVDKKIAETLEVAAHTCLDNSAAKGVTCTHACHLSDAGKILDLKEK